MNTDAPESNGSMSLDERLLKEQGAITALRQTLIEQMEKFGFDDLVPSLNEELVNPELRKDNFDGSQSFFAEWRTPTGALLGFVLIHERGNLYAEFDVVKPHPEKKMWFVEAMTAWGDRQQIKAEPRLLPAL